MEGAKDAGSMELNHSLLVKWPWHFLPMTHCAESKRERACLHGGGGSQVGEAKYGWSPHLSCNRDQITMRDYGQTGYPT